MVKRILKSITNLELIMQSILKVEKKSKTKYNCLQQDKKYIDKRLDY